MKVTLPFGQETKLLELPLESDQVMVAQSKLPSTDRTWADAVGDALREPIGAPAIRDQRLAGKRVVILADDWVRPTPAAQVVPLLLRELEATGVEDRDIMFIIAAGMHHPMTAEDMARKLGPEVAARYRCSLHDAADRDNLRFCGVSDQGTPIWINRHVVEADYRIALGRIYPHQAYGYEGSYKMLVPGVAGLDTIARTHAYDISPSCLHCLPDNPARREADAIGRRVPIHFLINVVVNPKGEPMKAFCGEPLEVHRRGIAWGDREVWGAELPRLADITVVSPGSGEPPRSGYDLEALHRAARVTREDGCIIGVTARDMTFDEPEAAGLADDSVCHLSQDEFIAALRSLSFAELLRLHDMRNWPLSELEIHWRIRAVRNECYDRARLERIRKRKLILTADPNAALQRALAESGSSHPMVAVLPEARTTFARVA